MIALLLNWRVWIAIALGASLVITGLGGYRLGRNQVQASFDAYKNQQIVDASKQKELAATKEQAMQTSTLKVGDDNATRTSQTSHAISNLAALRLRQQSPNSSLLSPNSSASQSTPDTPKDGVLGECRARRDELAGEAQELSDQVTGLQEYIKGVLNENH